MLSSTATWIVIYVVQALWWLWLGGRGGSRWVHGWGIGWLIAPVPPWDAEVIRVIAWVSFAGSTFWFVLGLVDPAVRPFFQ